MRACLRPAGLPATKVFKLCLGLLDQAPRWEPGAAFQVRVVRRFGRIVVAEVLLLLLHHLREVEGSHMAIRRLAAMCRLTALPRISMGTRIRNLRAGHQSSTTLDLACTTKKTRLNCRARMVLRHLASRTEAL